MTPLTLDYVQPREELMRMLDTQLEQPSLSERAAWLYVALAEISDLQKAGENIPGVGDFRIPERTVNRARQLLALIDVKDLPVPNVIPFSGGGLAFQFCLGRKEAKFTIFPDAEVCYFTAEDEVLLEDGPLALRRTAVAAPLQWLMQA